MSDFRDGTVADRGTRLEIRPGRSFAFVSALGGYGVRLAPNADERWAAVHSAETGARGGALFCTFDGPSAECRFEDITGAVPDTFSLASANAAGDGEEALRDAVRWSGPGAAPVTSGPMPGGGGAVGPFALFVGLGLVVLSVTRRRTSAFGTLLEPRSRSTRRVSRAVARARRTAPPRPAA